MSSRRNDKKGSLVEEEVRKLNKQYRDRVDWVIFGSSKSGVSTLFAQIERSQPQYDIHVLGTDVSRGTAVQKGLISMLNDVLPFAGFKASTEQAIISLHLQVVIGEQEITTDILDSLKAVLTSKSVEKSLLNLIVSTYPPLIPKLCSHLLYCIEHIKDEVVALNYIPRDQDYLRLSLKPKSKSFETFPLFSRACDNSPSLHLSALHQSPDNVRRWGPCLDPVNAAMITIPIDRFDEYYLDTSSSSSSHDPPSLSPPKIEADDLMLTTRLNFIPEFISHWERFVNPPIDPMILIGPAEVRPVFVVFTGADIFAKKLATIPFASVFPESVNEISDPQDPSQVYSWIVQKYLNFQSFGKPLKVFLVNLHSSHSVEPLLREIEMILHEAQGGRVMH